MIPSFRISGDFPSFRLLGSGVIFRHSVIPAFRVATMSTTVSTTTRRGQTETSSMEIQYRRAVNLKLPPKTTYSVKMTATVEKRRVSVTLPSKIQGPFCIQYPQRRDGHYYWISICTVFVVRYSVK